MASQGRLPYEHHGGFYRGLAPGDDLTKPWEWTPVSNHFLPLSPLKPVFELPRAPSTSPVSTLASPTISTVILPVKERGIWARIKQFIKSGESLNICWLLYVPTPCRLGRFSVNEEIAISAYEPAELVYASTRKVEAHEWKQYGYWARPIIDDLICINSRKALFMH